MNLRQLRRHCAAKVQTLDLPWLRQIARAYTRSPVA
jgi:hypothetical protein